MIWFGSSARVALSNIFPESRNAIAWVRGGWHVALAYVIGFFVMLAVLDWHPQSKHEPPTQEHGLGAKPIVSQKKWQGAFALPSAVFQER